HSYIVTRDGKPVGTLDMADLVRALVPRVASDPLARRS
ncbi:MAG: glycine betaine/L-proline ABC transporter ATP-binding protein, partial [Alphaproteobacteria bacterium]